MFFDAKYETIYIEEKLINQIEKFWIFFRQNETKLIEALYNKDKSFLKEFEDQINLVFYRRKKDIGYSFLFRDNKKIFTIYFGYSSYVMTVANTLFDYPDKKLINDWEFDLKKSRKYVLFAGNKPL